VFSVFQPRSLEIAPVVRRLAVASAAALALGLPACGGQISGDGGGSGDPQDPVGPQARAVSTGPAVGRRLTREEVVNSIEVVLDVELDPEVYGLPRDARIPEGFRNSSADLLLSPARIEAYDAMAEAAVAQIDVSRFVGRYAACTDMNASCYDSFTDGVGTLILRRPVSDSERPLFSRLFSVAEEEGESFEAGAALVMRAMLQSPRFLYRLESQSGGDAGATREVDPYELATRLSFLVWNAAPDEELVELAAGGNLRANLDAQVERLLGHPRARRAFRQYIEQWLYLDAIPETFELGRDMKEETYRLFERLAWDEDADLMEAFTAKQATLSEGLASFYGIEPLQSGFADYDLTASPERIGFLTNASVMAARTINPTSSMIDRGLFVLNDLFCMSVAPPDAPELQAAIEEVAVAETSGLSQRERFAIQSETDLCRGCHGMFDPLGLAFERYGAAGQYITQDEFGNLLPGGGSVDLGDVRVDYRDVTEFANALAESQTVAQCVAKKSVQHAYGRKLSNDDGDLLADIYAAFDVSGRSYRGLIRAIASHPEFGIVEVAP
jgi:hypothetical protein